MTDRDLWVAHVDGGCYPNPEGVMGIGVHLADPEGHTVAELSERPAERGTNNEAEYRAIFRAVETAFENGARRLEVRADSKLTVKTLDGSWNLKAENLKPWRTKILDIAENLDEVRFRWIPRERNTTADRLATEAMGGRVDGGPKHAESKRGARAATAPATGTKPTAEGALCTACKAACTFQWQTFKNGKRHIRQTCPNHGFLRYAPMEEVYAKVADQSPPYRK